MGFKVNRTDSTKPENKLRTVDQIRRFFPIFKFQTAFQRHPKRECLFIFHKKFSLKVFQHGYETAGLFGRLGGGLPRGVAVKVFHPERVRGRGLQAVKKRILVHFFLMFRTAGKAWIYVSYSVIHLS